MRALFADTFYWIALADAADSAHRRALELTSTWRDVLVVTTDEVPAEHLTFFATAHENMRRKALINARRILQNPGVRVISQTHASLLSGMELYEARPDKRYSLTDCVSMQTMRREGLTEALTNDRHFEQEGFRMRSTLPDRLLHRRVNGKLPVPPILGNSIQKCVPGFPN